MSPEFSCLLVYHGISWPLKWKNLPVSAIVAFSITAAIPPTLSSVRMLPSPPVRSLHVSRVHDYVRSMAKLEIIMFIGALDAP
ncbi:hypothetical protein V7S43_011833 [Phytophthora oleae]|uniref:Uncharacterized protein n=1 Tax=Phytophthora oleae TaxID=2107226 RepID=A0ABD3F9K0_9STRA